MNRILIAAVIATLLLAGLWTGCEDECTTDTGIQGSGTPLTEEFDFSDFNRVEAGPAYRIEIVQSDSYSVSVTVDDNLIDYVDVFKSGDRLKIGLKPGDRRFTILEAKITMPDLYAVELNAATHCTVSGFSFTHKFAADLSSACTLDGDITTGDADLVVSAASTLYLQGAGGDLIIEASAASTVDLADFTVNNADVNLSGASTAVVHPDGRLDAEVSGASTLMYTGEPTLGDLEVSGSSKVQRK